MKVYFISFQNLSKNVVEYLDFKARGLECDWSIFYYTLTRTVLWEKCHSVDKL